MDQEPALSKLNTNEGRDQKSYPVLKYIGFEPVHLDRILEMSGLTPGETASQLLQLEIAGKIKSLPGNIYVRL